jgi:hypothetical protein
VEAAGLFRPERNRNAPRERRLDERQCTKGRDGLLFNLGIGDVDANIPCSPYIVRTLLRS